MSLEAALAENTASNAAVVAALTTNSSLLERVVAGQHAAMEKLAAGAPAAPRTRRGKATDAADPAAQPAAEPASEPEAPAVAEVTEADVKGIAVPYLGGVEPYAYGADETKATRGQFLKAIADHFGSPTLVGEKATLGADERKQTVFFLKRKIAGAEVNFSQDYDFDGDPTQGAAAAEADEFDIG